MVFISLPFLKTQMHFLPNSDSFPTLQWPTKGIYASLCLEKLMITYLPIEKFIWYFISPSFSFLFQNTACGNKKGSLWGMGKLLHALLPNFWVWIPPGQWFSTLIGHAQYYVYNLSFTIRNKYSSNSEYLSYLVTATVQRSTFFLTCGRFTDDGCP